MKNLCVSALVLLAFAAPLAAAGAPTVEKKPFGQTKAGVPVSLYTLDNGTGMRAGILTLGAIIYFVEAPDRDGRLANVTLNRETAAEYEEKSFGFGSLIGRYANRIAKGRFTLDGHEYPLAVNAAPNHIHGGLRGFDKRIWAAEPLQDGESAGVRLTYLSVDGEEGYPGNLRCVVTYRLTRNQQFWMEFTATTDKPTVVNLCNHAYWNLAGAESGDVLGQILTTKADQYLPADASLIPTGEILPVAGTPLDFSTPHTIGERIGDFSEPQFKGGYDHCLVVERTRAGDRVPCARLEDPKSGRFMEVSTTAPGMQLYSGNFPAGAITGPGGYPYPAHPGLAIETQAFPDSPNQPKFPSVVLRPGATYRSVTVLRFGVTAAPRR